MDRRKFSFSIVAAAVLAGCGGGSGPEAASPVADPAPLPDPVVPPQAGPELATATALPAMIAFGQTVDATDGDGQYAPGQANVFDLRNDFAISDGYNDQFDGALQLVINVAGTDYPFPSDQLYAELTALGPELGAADGVKTVTFTADPAWTSSPAAVLHPVSDARLQQTLDLRSAAGHAVDLTWSGSPQVSPSGFNEPYYFRVVVRDTAGALLSTLFLQDDLGISGTWGSASLSAFGGQVVVLSFEQRSTWGCSRIDDVSVVDVVTTTQFVTNGDFVAGATGWTVPAPRVSQNVRSGARTVPGVGSVERSFFTQPNARWGRMTDVFTNTSGAPLTATVKYHTNLGSDGAGIIYATPGAPAKALSTWDGARDDRDVGLVFGAADVVAFQSASALSTYDGNDDIDVEFNITVPTGGSVTIVNFVIFVGGDTGQSAAGTSARATEVDALAADIANNFRTNLAYQRGLTQAQLDTLKNF